MNESPKEFLIVISGPSGVGKSSVVAGLRKRYLVMKKVVTATTRLPRLGEKDGQDYKFITRDEFESLVRQDVFFEWINYRGNWYGTPKNDLEEAVDSGNGVIWQINVRGVEQIKSKIKEIFPNSIFIFIGVKDINTLKERLEKRGTGKEEIKWDLRKATWELDQAKYFDHVVENEEGKLKQTIDKVAGIVERAKLPAM